MLFKKVNQILNLLYIFCCSDQCNFWMPGGWPINDNVIHSKRFSPFQKWTYFETLQAHRIFHMAHFHPPCTVFDKSVKPPAWLCCLLPLAVVRVTLPGNMWGLWIEKNDLLQSNSPSACNVIYWVGCFMPAALSFIHWIAPGNSNCRTLVREKQSRFNKLLNSK